MRPFNDMSDRFLRFQFQLVRLKSPRGNLIVLLFLVSIPTGSIKIRNRENVQWAYDTFQFQLVRLKCEIVNNIGVEIHVSIPTGSIKIRL